MRIRIQSSGISNSARELSHYLRIKRLKQRNSKFRFRRSDIIINWGLCEDNGSQYVNPLPAVGIAANKLHTLQTLASADISIPEFSTTKPADSEELWLARTTLFGHSGQGIVVDCPQALPPAPLYVKHIPKVAEYRAIVVNGVIIDFKQKKRKRSTEEAPVIHNKYIWNRSNNYVFCRGDVVMPSSIEQLSKDTMTTLGLVYGALDIIEDDIGNLYVLEVNTKFGLQGSTTQLVGDAIHAYIHRAYR